MNSNKLNICIIGVYFGKFNNYFELWKKSCQYNTTIDFLIFTDQEINYDIPRNMKIIKMNLEECKNLIEKKLEMKISLEKAYKLCDFKPVYGKIFEDYIKEYDYWGHCDFDIILGDLRYFTNKYDLKKYDKFLNRGHLSLYRNTEKVNNYYKLEGSQTENYKIIFANSKNFSFDETTGINKIFEKNKIPFFQKRIYGDIDPLYKRFRQSIRSKEEKNYNYQAYYWEKGHVYRAYYYKKKIFLEELAYIHLQKRKFEEIKFDYKSIESFFITNEGFKIKNSLGTPSLEEIKENNKFEGKIYEKKEYINYLKKNFRSLFFWHMERNLIGKKILKILRKIKKVLTK